MEIVLGVRSGKKVWTHSTRLESTPKSRKVKALLLSLVYKRNFNFSCNHSIILLYCAASIALAINLVLTLRIKGVYPSLD